MNFEAFARTNARLEFDPNWRGMSDEEYRVIRQQNQRIYDRYQQRLRDERERNEAGRTQAIG